MFRFALVALFFGVGCGPVQSTAYLMDTQNMLEAARTAQAERFAPYEWTKANLFYVKSKEEVGYSEFEQGVAFAKTALDYATKARDNALKLLRSGPGDSSPETPAVKP
jgi:hypothetical protein